MISPYGVVNIQDRERITLEQICWPFFTAYLAPSSNHMRQQLQFFADRRPYVKTLRWKVDILFIDSSHVSKTGSDVNFLFFDVLPRLKKGVLIHIHDIFYPFLYPEKWVLGGINGNEAFLLRAMLSCSNRYRILFWTDHISKVNPEIFDTQNLDESKGEKKCGQSLWLQVTGWLFARYRNQANGFGNAETITVFH